MKKIFVILEVISLAICFCSCKQKPASSSELQHAESTLPAGTAPTDTIIHWDDQYPRDVRIVGDWLCVLMAKTDTCMYLYDKVTGAFSHRLGVLGGGPEDMMSPEFVKNNCEGENRNLLLCDINAGKRFSLTPDAQLTDFVPIHSRLSSINVVAGGVLGHPIGGKPTLWEMSDANGKALRVELQPSVPASLPEKVRPNLGYLYSCHVLAESQLRSVIVPMYFFDLIQVYDAQGNLRKLVSPQEGYDFEQNFQDVLQGNDYWGYPQCFSSERYCYLYRCLTDGVTRQVKKSQLVKLDWEGNIVKSIELDRPLTSGFCVEDDTIAYCIVRDIKDDQEMYRLVRYTL